MPISPRGLKCTAKRTAALLCLNIEFLRRLLDNQDTPETQTFYAVLGKENPYLGTAPNDPKNSLRELFNRIFQNCGSNSRFWSRNTEEVSQYLYTRFLKEPSLINEVENTLLRHSDTIEEFYEKEPSRLRESKLKALKESLSETLGNYISYLGEESEYKGSNVYVSEHSSNTLKKKLEAAYNVKQTLYQNEKEPTFKKLCSFSKALNEEDSLLRTHRNSLLDRILKGIAETFMSICSCGLSILIHARQKRSFCFWRPEGSSAVNNLSTLFKKSTYAPSV